MEEGEGMFDSIKNALGSVEEAKQMQKGAMRMQLEGCNYKISYLVGDNMVEVSGMKPENVVKNFILFKKEVEDKCQMKK